MSASMSVSSAIYLLVGLLLIIGTARFMRPAHAYLHTLPVFVLTMLMMSGGGGSQAERSPIVRSEFIFAHAPFPSAHASTIVETRDGLVAAWFGGTKERDPDAGIWVSRHDASGWSTPIEVANGVQPNGARHPCWNPVLFQPSGGPLLLFYKVGPSPSQWWGLARTSSDGGRTWSAAGRLPAGILGPIRAKPVEARPGVMLAGSSTEDDGWIAHMERFAGSGDRARSVRGPAPRWRDVPTSPAFMPPHLLLAQDPESHLELDLELAHRAVLHQAPHLFLVQTPLPEPGWSGELLCAPIVIRETV